MARRRALADRFASARPLLRLAVANLRRRKAQSALLVAGIALGVAVVVAIDLANASALAAFRRSAAAVTGRATHRVVGGPTGIDARDYVRIATDPSLTAVAAAPVVEGLVEVPALGDRTLTLLGIDPLADAPFRDLLTGTAGDQASVVALSPTGGSQRGADRFTTLRRSGDPAGPARGRCPRRGARRPRRRRRRGCGWP